MAKAQEPEELGRLARPESEHLPRLALAGEQERVRGYLDRLAGDPPQVLILEGGTPDTRDAMALYWAALHNCASHNPPCLACRQCRQVYTGQHRDLFFFDGREGNIKVAPVRDMVSILGEPPRGEGRRAVIFSDAQNLLTEAANTLLKSLEEPRPGTVFVLLAPQRERLLPTLVSRGWVLTLAWPDPMSAEPEETDADVAEWCAAFTEFVLTGRGWFQKTIAKNAVSRETAFGLVLRVQRDLLHVLDGEPRSELARVLADRLDVSGLRRLDVALDHCLTALNAGPAGVTPPLVLDWLATRVFLSSR